MSADMFLVSLILLVLVFLIFTVLVLLWRCGLFLDIDIKTCKPPFQQLEVAYKFARGSYKDCGQLYTEAHSVVPRLRCIGIYYDDPAEVDGNSLRYIIGLIMNDKDEEVSDEEKQMLLAKGFQTTTFPEVEYVVHTSFPHQSFASFLIAVHRVIPRLREYIKEKKLQAYPLIEICGGPDILYVAPLSKQSEFFVYEALAESEEEMTSEQKTVDENDDVSNRDLEELPDTVSSLDSLIEGGSKIEELPSNEDILDSLEEKGVSNGSEASTESFEELQLDS